MRRFWSLLVALILIAAFVAPVAAQQGVLSSSCADTIVYGEDGATHNWTWLQANYGAQIQCAELGANVHHFHLYAVGIDVSGVTNTNIWCAYADGSPCISQPATYSYPTLDEPSSGLASIPAGYVTRYASRGVLNKNLTDGAGHVSFQWGSDSWINSDTGKGPYSIWMLSPSTPSDALIYTGWRAGTEHHGPVTLYFKEVLGATTATATPAPAATAWPSPTPGPTATPGAAGSVDLTETNSLLQQILDALKVIGAHLGVTFSE